MFLFLFADVSTFTELLKELVVFALFILNFNLAFRNQQIDRSLGRLSEGYICFGDIVVNTSHKKYDVCTDFEPGN